MNHQLESWVINIAGLICVPSVVRLFREDKLLASATLEGEKFALRTARAEGALGFVTAEKAWRQTHYLGSQGILSSLRRGALSACCSDSVYFLN